MLERSAEKEIVKLREYISENVQEYLESVPPALALETYALSMWVSDESDIGMQAVVLSVAIHTESQVKERLKRCNGDEFEARWSFPVWGDPYEAFEWSKNNYKTILGEARDCEAYGLEHREEWLRKNSLWNLDEGDFEDIEELFQTEADGIEKFWAVVSEVALGLREKGVISRVFGRNDVLLVIHRAASNYNNLETKQANPDIDVDEMLNQARS